MKEFKERFLGELLHEFLKLLQELLEMFSKVDLRFSF